MFIINNSIYIAFYIIFNIQIYYLYDILHRIFKQNKMYLQITPKHKQIYFVSNLIKGLYLALFTPLAIYVLYNYFNNNIWNVKLIKLLGGMYSSLDFVSIIKVKKMQLNTQIHHVIVQILFLISLLFYDFKANSIAKSVVVYAIFSTFSFLVNIYLAFRLILTNKKWVSILATISSIIYQGCCTVNWLYQCHYIVNYNSGILFKLMYTLILFSIITDDIVLIKFLNKNSLLTTK